MEVRKPLFFVGQQQGHTKAIRDPGSQGCWLLHLQWELMACALLVHGDRTEEQLKLLCSLQFALKLGLALTISPESRHQSMSLTPSSFPSQPFSYPLMRNAEFPGQSSFKNWNLGNAQADLTVHFSVLGIIIIIIIIFDPAPKMSLTATFVSK